MNNENEIEIVFSLDIPQLKQELSEAEQLMAAGVQRLNNLQQGDTPTVVSSPQGAPPPVPPPPTGGRAVTAAQEELEQIRQISADAPDVALAALSGRGGLLGRVQRGAIALTAYALPY